MSPNTKIQCKSAPVPITITMLISLGGYIFLLFTDVKSLWVKLTSISLMHPLVVGSVWDFTTLWWRIWWTL